MALFSLTELPENTHLRQLLDEVIFGMRPLELHVLVRMYTNPLTPTAAPMLVLTEEVSERQCQIRFSGETFECDCLTGERGRTQSIGRLAVNTGVIRIIAFLAGLPNWEDDPETLLQALHEYAKAEQAR